MKIVTPKSCTKIPRSITTVLLIVLTIFVMPAQASESKLSEALDVEGLRTLKTVLELTDLISVLESNHVTVFAPTDDVFDATAEALGCKDATDLATKLLNTSAGDGSALAAILTYHAVLDKIDSTRRLLTHSPITTANGKEIKTGVNAKGLYVKGIANEAPSSITVEGITGKAYVIYPIDSVLLPFELPSGLCGG